MNSKQRTIKRVRRTRRLFCETLESRYLMAVDLETSAPYVPSEFWNDSDFLSPSLTAPPAPPAAATADDRWIASGPTAIFDGQTENVPGNRVSGAVNALVVHPTDADIIWVGTTNGGIWKTTNATAANPSWTPRTDEYDSLSIGAMAMDTADATSNTLWAGIGRTSSLGRDGGRRLGVLKSTNGGNSWINVAGSADLVGKNISGMTVHGNTIVVSVNIADDNSVSGPNVGIFRSTNGGASFTRVSTAAGSGLPNGSAYDLVVDPTNSSVLYTGIWGGTADGIYKSSNRGSTWTRVSSQAINNRLSSVTSNIELAVGKANNVYVGIINQGVLDGLFRSGNGGTSWVELDNPKTNENGNLVGLHPRPKGPGLGSTPDAIAGGQGFLHFSIVADPVNPNIVYVGGDRQPLEFGSPNSIGATEFAGRLFRVDASKPANTQAISLTHNPTTNSNSAPHADSRDMAFSPDGSLIEVDDGGIYRRTNPRTTGDWFGMQGNMQNTEIHSIAYDSLSNVLIAGTQDVGTPVQRVNSTVWDELSKGDGGIVQVDNITLAAQNRSIRYSSFFTLNGFTKSVYDANNNKVGSFRPALTVVGNGNRIDVFDSTLPFYTPVLLNQVNPTRGLILSNAIYESFDQFETVTSTASAASSITAAAYGGTGNADVIYVGFSGGFFVRPTVGGSYARNTGYTGQTPVDIALDPDNWQTGFIADSDQVFFFSGAGSSVAEVTGNLSAVSNGAKIRTVAYIPGVGADAVIVGTDTGTFMMESTAVNVWEPYGINIPNAPVMDLRYNVADNVLIAGTLGRGAWRIPNASGTIGNQAPNVTVPSTVLAYRENGAVQFAGAGGSVSDTDSSNFATGKLLARISANSETADRLQIRPQGPVTTNASSQVLVDGTIVGTFVNATGSSTLSVTFNNAATPARVAQVLRSVAYFSTSQNPSTAQRTVQITISDGDGSSSNVVARRISVTSVNDAPVLAIASNAAVNYTLNSATAVAVAGAATVQDSDSANFAGGKLTANFTQGASSSNRLLLSGRFSFSSNNVLLDGTTVIGTRNANGGVGTNLVITFNNAATPTVAQLLVRSLRFRTVNGATGQRRLSLTIGDGDSASGVSSTLVRTINVA